MKASLAEDHAPRLAIQMDGAHVGFPFAHWRTLHSCWQWKTHVVFEKHDWNLLIALCSADPHEPLLNVLAAAASRPKEVDDDKHPTAGSIINDEIEFLLALDFSHTFGWANLWQPVRRQADALQESDLAADMWRSRHGSILETPISRQRGMGCVPVGNHCC